MTLEIGIYLLGYITMVALLLGSYFRNKPKNTKLSDDAAAIMWSVMIGIGSWLFVAIFFYEVWSDKKFKNRNENL